MESWDFSPLPRYGELTTTVSGDHRFYVSAPFEVEYEEGHIERVPVGFRTDFASIPWFARWAFRTWGRWSRPAVYHDYCLDYHTVPRKEADKRFLRGLEIEGVSWLGRTLMYYGVRANSVVKEAHPAKLIAVALVLMLAVLLVGKAWAFETGEKISFDKAPVCKSIESLQVLSKGFGEEDISGTWAQYRKAGECFPGRAHPFVVVVETHGVLRFGQYIMQVVEFTAQDGKSRFVPLSDPRQPSM